MSRLTKKQLRARSNGLWAIIVDKLKFEKYLSEDEASALKENKYFQSMIFISMTEYKKREDLPDFKKPETLETDTIGRVHQLSMDLQASGDELGREGHGKDMAYLKELAVTLADYNIATLDELKERLKK